MHDGTVNDIAAVDYGDELAKILLLVGHGRPEEAARLASERFSFVKKQAAKRRRLSHREQAALFERDGYRCRYFGDKLVFPGVLLLIEKHLHTAFPVDQGYRVASSHWIYWKLWPVVDHLQSIAFGAADPYDAANLVTTSTFRNTQKMHWSLDDLGWSDRGAPKSNSEWDGLVGWFRNYMAKCDDPETWGHRNMRSWARAVNVIPPLTVARRDGGPVA